MAMKRTLTSALLAAGLVAGASQTLAPVHASAASYAPASNFTIIVEDKEIAFDPAPFLIDNRTFVPLRSLSEGLGADVQYDGTTNIATITKEDTVLTLNFNTGVVKKNGQQMNVDPAPRFVNNRTMVPVRFISEAFGNHVTFEAGSQTVRVLPTDKTLQQRQVLRDLLNRSTEASNAKSSYTVDLKLNGQIPSALGSMKFDGTITSEMVQKTYDMHMHGSMTTSYLFQKQEVPLDMYMVNGVTYVLDPNTRVWQKDASGQSDWMKMVEMTTQMPGGTSNAQGNPLLPYGKVTEDADSYNVSFKLDQRGVEKLAQAGAAGAAANGQINADQLKQLSQSVSGVTLSYEIDKTTFLQDNLKVSMDVSIPNVGKVNVNVDGKLKYDAVTSIELPDEAKNANDSGK
jgi:hypothetical protein